jgi:uncharacterized protein YbjQ (UPF0145 family)
MVVGGWANGPYNRGRAAATARASWGPEFDRIANGEVPSSTAQRLRELVRWGGSTSFLSPAGLWAADVSGMQPIGQVLGLSAGVLDPRLASRARGVPAGFGVQKGELIGTGDGCWREDDQIVREWGTLRQRALARLTKQARTLGAQAVIGIKAQRQMEAIEEGASSNAVVQFTGTAVAVESWRRRENSPVLTLASAQELSVMMRLGIEPVGIVGGFARIELFPGSVTTMNSGSVGANIELVDLTWSATLAKNRALKRLHIDAASLKASGVVGVDLDLTHTGAARATLPGMVFTAHAIASAIRRGARPALPIRPIVRLSHGGDG